MSESSDPGAGAAGAAAEPSSDKPAKPGFVAPWGDGPPQRADMIILWTIAFSGIYVLITLPLVAPLIGHHPVLLALIRGSTAAVITLGAHARIGDGNLVVAITAGLPGLILFDWAFWWAGKRWGENALHMLFKGKRAAKRINTVHKVSHRWGWLLVITGYIGPIPTALIAVAVGLGGMSLLTYMILDAIGALIWLSLMALLGYWIGKRAVDVAQTVSHYALWITLGLVAVILLRQVWMQSRRSATTS